MSKTLPPCDHDDCLVTECLKEPKNFGPEELKAYLRENMTINMTTGFFKGMGMSLKIELSIDGEVIADDHISLSYLTQN